MRFRFRLRAIVSRIVVSGALVVTWLLSSCEYGSDTGSGALAWSPDGTKIAFSSMRSVSQDIWVMSAGGTNETNTNAISGNPNPTWSPDGSKIAFSSSDVSPPGYSHIWVMDTDGSNLVNLTCKVRASSVDPAGSPDDQRIAFTRYQGAYAIYLGHEYRRQQSNKAYVIK